MSSYIPATNRQYFILDLALFLPFRWLRGTFYFKYLCCVEHLCITLNCTDCTILIIIDSLWLTFMIRLSYYWQRHMRTTQSKRLTANQGRTYRFWLGGCNHEIRPTHHWNVNTDRLLVSCNKIEYKAWKLMSFIRNFARIRTVCCETSYFY